MTDRFWWPGTYADENDYVKTCDICQRMKELEPYVPSMFISLSSLFDVFLIDFAGLFPATKGGNRFL